MKLITQTGLSIKGEFVAYESLSNSDLCADIIKSDWFYCNYILIEILHIDSSFA